MKIRITDTIYGVYGDYVDRRTTISAFCPLTKKMCGAWKCAWFEELEREPNQPENVTYGECAGAKSRKRH